MPYQPLKHADITEKVIGCAMKVHRCLGPGFPEVIYHRSLVIELEKSKMAFASECSRNVLYEGILIGSRRLDLVVEDKVLVELKAVSEVDNAIHAQVINYLKVFNIEVGLLLNFGSSSLGFKRFVNSVLVNK